MASAVLEAVSTSKPCSSRTALRVSRTARSSSTRRIRRFIRTPEKKIGDARCESSAASLPHLLHGSIEGVASFYIENFGCRATQADGAALERQFAERGLERAKSARDAEIVILNTCTVTEGAD